MYCLYYPEEGRYSRPMSYPEAIALQRQFNWASVVNLKTGEVYS